MAIFFTRTFDLGRGAKEALAVQPSPSFWSESQHFDKRARVLSPSGPAQTSGRKQVSSPADKQSSSLLLVGQNVFRAFVHMSIAVNCFSHPMVQAFLRVPNKASQPAAAPKNKRG